MQAFKQSRKPGKCKIAFHNQGGPAFPLPPMGGAGPGLDPGPGLPPGAGPMPMAAPPPGPMPSLGSMNGNGGPTAPVAGSPQSRMPIGAILRQRRKGRKPSKRKF